ncbi:CDP-glycerol glycerophosphotransferase [Spirochaetia bacterium]|nr:CDP-glycerol glycerophosphotransferase [Spirochaetia bacterium]
MFALYIDPGTGSMLLSILLGAAATVYFLARALIIRLKVFFQGGNVRNQSRTSNPFVVYNEEKRYCNLFKPVLEEFEKRQIPLLYLSYGEDDPAFSAGYRFITAKAIGEGNKAFAYLNFLSASFVLMTTPGLQVYQLKRSKNVKHYAFLEHSVTDSTQYRLFGLDYFDSLLLNSDYQVPHLRFIEKKRGLPEKQMVTVGCPYLDVFTERMKTLPKEEDHPFTVLVSPSWGASGLLARYGEKLIDELEKTAWRIIVRPHPQSKISEAAILDRLTKRYDASKNIQWDFERENIFSLSKADIMISDFSGIIFDYLFLFDKPVLYNNQNFDMRPYDSYDLEDELWQFKTLKKVGVELKEDMFPCIEEVVNSIADNAELRDARHTAKAEAWMYQGEAGKRVADFMIETVSTLQ